MWEVCNYEYNKNIDLTVVVTSFLAITNHAMGHDNLFVCL